MTIGSAGPARAQDPFQTNVRPTKPLSARQELAGFRLPPGFEIQLVASEPDIFKPMNIAFDQRGRLWVTDSTEYPFPVSLDKPGRDSVKILEDTDGDGRADKITTFADGLNIPIGVVPIQGGAIVYGIPNIWLLRDTDGDDRADERIRLYGPMGFERDTHGMNNSFRRDFDGWVYACHGFNNITTVAGRDGHVVHMQSGNTYRMRPDGSRIEQFTWGQVNPFGMAVDALGNRFTADCHSKPIYQLVRGGHYPSFGKPHGGLGFVPPMMDHLHGSTAIAGVAEYTGRNFPAEYRGNLFSGNVMTSRVNRNRLEYRGATIKAVEEPDFLIASDPWFRPVDVRVGPDGALYIADFYNRIIGHYEVPLEHPGRDRTRGRIWRIVYRGDAAGTKPATLPKPLSEETVQGRIAALGDPSLPRRLAATNYLADIADGAALDALHRAVISSERAAELGERAIVSSEEGRLRAHGLWVLFRRDRLDDDLLLEAARADDRLVATHAMLILGQKPAWTADHFRAAREGLTAGDAFVRRAAAEALGQHPNADNLRPLFDLLGRVDTRDAVLRYTVRLALRDNLRVNRVFDALDKAMLKGAKLKKVDARELAAICPALPSTRAASFLLEFLQSGDAPRASVAQYVQHAARYIAPEQTASLAVFVRRRFSDDIDFQWLLLNAMVAGIEQRGGQFDRELKDWADQLAGVLLGASEATAPTWTNAPLPGKPPSDNPWDLQKRSSEDGDTTSLFFCSLPRGERLTGVLRSRAFEIPASLSFYTAGHLGFPDKPLAPRNFIRLRDAKTHALIKEARPPRHDTARKIHWDLQAHAGRRGYLELVDGDDRAAFAWLAVGRFQPPVAPFPAVGPRRESRRIKAGADLVGKFRLERYAGRLKHLLQNGDPEPSVGESLAEALLKLSPDQQLQALLPLVGDPTVSTALRDRILDCIVRRDAESTSGVLAEAIRRAPRRGQQLLAHALAGDKANSQLLLDLVQRGHASPRLLRDPTVVARLRALHGESIMQRLAKLTAGIAPEDEVRRALMNSRRAAFAKSSPSVERGRRVFEKNCAACHQLAGKGPLIGPQLDGIGNRGPDRLVEDIVDPNRNVDVAFNTTTLAMNDGKVVTGLVRREEGAQLVMVDAQGKEFTVDKNAIDERAKIRLSLMPENLVERMTESEFCDLLAFLLEHRAAPIATSD